MLEELKEFLNHKYHLVRETAIAVQELSEDLKGGNLSKSEYDELIEDLLDTKKIDGLADTIENKAKIEKVFNLLKTAISKIV